MKSFAHHKEVFSFERSLGPVRHVHHGVGRAGLLKMPEKKTRVFKFEKFCHIFFFHWQTRKFSSVTFVFYLKLLALSHALIQILIVGLLALSFPKEVGGSPRKTGSKEKETAFNNLTENTAAPLLVSSFPRTTGTSREAVAISGHWLNKWVKYVVPHDSSELYAYPER